MKLRRDPAPWYHGGWWMLRRYPGLWFVWSPGGHVIHTLLWRVPPYKRLMDWLIGRDIRHAEARDPWHEPAR